jgi:hypothetical protein
MRQITLLLALAACSPQGTLPQMEGTSFNWETSPLEAGTLSATGARKDWSLVLTTTEGAFPFTIHTANAFDLSVLDGRTGVTLREGTSTGEENAGEGPQPWLEDADGLLFASSPQDGLSAWRSFATLGEVRVTAQKIGYASAIFHGDDGDVELLPGESEAIAKDGVLYEVGVITALKDMAKSHKGDKCGPPPQKLEWEILRVDAEAEPRVSASENADARFGCGG